MKINILSIQSYNFNVMNEISQQDNWNANARLWIQEDNTVFKQYIKYNRITCKNIKNLLKLSKNITLYSINEIAMPIQIYRNGIRICGYTMPYCKGKPLEDVLMSSEIDAKKQLICLMNLGKVICNLPANVYIGDLHGHNVLVEENADIHIIDIDGFSIQGSEITCPISKKMEIGSIGKIKKYRHRNGRFKISRDSDIFCFYMLMLSWLSKVDAFQFDKGETFLYLEYLEGLGFPQKVINSIHKLFSNKSNSIEMNAFFQIDLEKMVQYDYNSFVNFQQLTSGEGRRYMTLRERVNQLDSPETFEERAQIVAERECKIIIDSIENTIKSKQYKIEKGIKQVKGHMYPSIYYYVGQDYHYSDSPHYFSGSDRSYSVNNKTEAEYFVNTIVNRLETEGCVCKVELRTRKSSNGIGFWDSIFKGSTTTYIYNISYVFQWNN